jgi:hypothetical protein
LHPPLSDPRKPAFNPDRHHGTGRTDGTTALRYRSDGSASLAGRDGEARDFKFSTSMKYILLYLMIGSSHRTEKSDQFL